MRFTTRNQQSMDNYSHNIKVFAFYLIVLTIVFVSGGESRAKTDSSATYFSLLYSGNTSGFTEPSG